MPNLQFCKSQFQKTLSSLDHRQIFVMLTYVKMYKLMENTQTSKQYIVLAQLHMFYMTFQFKHTYLIHICNSLYTLLSQLRNKRFLSQ